MNPKNKQLEDAFDKFISSSNVKEIISSFNQLCDIADLNPAENSSSFYSLLRHKYQGYWKANSLFAKLDRKVLQKEYRKQTACSKLKSLVIGAGPCGLRCAIELALLGARVVVLEKRDTFSRNNVLHLWPFVIHDLNFLGAKKFYGLFCSGSINHISIRRLQCILLKIALLFGVQVFIGVTFKELLPPKPRDVDTSIVTAEGDRENMIETAEMFGWRGKIEPSDHILSNYEFDAIVGADGKSNILGFKHKELRCRLAIAITANFINNNTPEEAQVEEISGVAFIFNQQFFKDLYNKTGIDLENIVYYKDETHYYVMTAKKHSLLAKGVLSKDYDDPEMLLKPDNINQEALQNYAKEAANVATNYKLSNLQFSLNHRGEADVALFDFTHMFAAENASMIVERSGFSLIKMLVGDSLLEPFWPTGSGCGLGFLSAMDGAWLVRRAGMIHRALSAGKVSDAQHQVLMLEALAERESVYQRLSQTNASNMPTNLDAYTIDPRTRYTQCKLNCIDIQQIAHLYETDDSMKASYLSSVSSTRDAHFNGFPSPKSIGLNNSFNSSLKDISITQEESAEGSIMKSEQILRWFQIRLDRYCDSKMFKIHDLNKSWSSGVPFLCLIHLYRPDLVDLASVNSDNKCHNLEKGIMLFEKEFKIRPMLNISVGWENQDPVKLVFYLEKIYATFQSLTPIRSDENIQPKVRDTRQLKRRPLSNSGGVHSPNFVNKCHMISHIGKPLRKSFFNRLKCNDIEKGIFRKRKEEILQQYAPKEQPPLTNTKTKGAVHALSDKLLHSKTHNIAKPTKTMERNVTRVNKYIDNQIYSNTTCHFCRKKILHTEQGKHQGFFYHKKCLKCQYCDKILLAGQFKLLEGKNPTSGYFYCNQHYLQMKQAMSKDRPLNERVKMKGDEVDSTCRFKKPKYVLKDFGEKFDTYKSDLLPVNQLFCNLFPISDEQLERKLFNVMLSLRRINDESDEDYNGSIDECDEDGTLLDAVEPLDDDQQCWSLGFIRYDIEYAMRKCSVIRRNRSLYKKYVGKEESTSEESDFNFDVSDKCRTSDEDFLDNSAIFGKPQAVEVPRSYQNDNNDSGRQTVQSIFKSGSICEPINVLTTSNNYNVVPSQAVENEIPYMLPNIIEPIENISSPKETEKVIFEENIVVSDNSNIAANGANSNKESSKSMRQLAKLKFCTEPPKPVSINPKEFIGQMNRNKMQIVTLPCCVHRAEKLVPIDQILLKVEPTVCLPAATGLASATILSATVLPTAPPSPPTLAPSQASPPRRLATLATDDFEPPSAASLELSRRPSGRRRQSGTAQSGLFADLCGADIKDIDSLSINTEDSSMTQTEVVPLTVPLRRATMDSDFSAALDVSQMPAGSGDSLDDGSPQSAGSAGLASDEGEGDGRPPGRPRVTRRPRQTLSLLRPPRGRAASSSDPGCPVIEEASTPAEAVLADASTWYPLECLEDVPVPQSVTPPQDVLLEDVDAGRGYEVQAPCEHHLGRLPGTTVARQRVCDIHRQLEDIEDRLRLLETGRAEAAP